MMTSVGGLRVSSAISAAGVHSAISVGNDQGVRMLFDIGVYERSFSNVRDVFISHGHTDHIGAIMLHARGARLQKGTPKYYVPTECIEALEQARIAFSTLNGDEIPMEIVSMSPGDSVVIGSNRSKFRVIALETKHRVQSQGYAVYSIVETKGKLLPEYKGLSGSEIGELKRNGTEIASPTTFGENLDLIYSGDTTFQGLLDCPQLSPADLFSADIVIMECTYLDGPYERAMEWDHVHIDDIVNHASLFEETGQLVLTHISARYQPWNVAVRLLSSALPPLLREKTVVTLREFGSKFVLSELKTAEELAEKRKSSPGFGWSSQSRKVTIESKVRKSKPHAEERLPSKKATHSDTVWRKDK